MLIIEICNSTIMSKLSYSFLLSKIDGSPLQK